MAFQWEWEQRIETLERANLALGGKVLDLKQEIEVLTTERDEARQQLADAILVAVSKMTERDRELEVITTERDNALLRIDELEARVTELEEMPDSEVGRAIVADWNEARGGVNPNA